MFGLPILLLTGLLILWLAGVSYTTWMLTHPPRRTYSTAVARGLPGDPSELPAPRRFESWTFRSRGLELPVWDIPGDDSRGPVVIMTCGWADSRIGGLIRLAPIIVGASRVILWELPSHGESPGICRLGTAEVEDLRALVVLLNADRLVLYGWSLGAGVSLAVAASHEGIGVIAETPYRLPQTPARNVMALRGMPASILIGPVFWILRRCLGPGLEPRIFDRATFASNVKSRVLAIHGDADEVCPVADGRDIAAACGAELLLIPGGRHNDLWTDPRHSVLIAPRVTAFLKNYTSA